MKYNAVMVSVFDICEIGYIECKNVVVMPWNLRTGSLEDAFSKLLLERQNGLKTILAAKFMIVKGHGICSFGKFKFIRKNYKIFEETQWYINPVYDLLDMKCIHSMADPSILLQGDLKRVKFRINYYVDLKQQGYSDQEAINLVYS